MPSSGGESAMFPAMPSPPPGVIAAPMMFGSMLPSMWRKELSVAEGMLFPDRLCGCRSIRGPLVNCCLCEASRG